MAPVAPSLPARPARLLVPEPRLWRRTPHQPGSSTAARSWVVEEHGFLRAQLFRRSARGLCSPRRSTSSTLSCPSKEVVGAGVSSRKAACMVASRDRFIMLSLGRGGEILRGAG